MVSQTSKLFTQSVRTFLPLELLQIRTCFSASHPCRNGDTESHCLQLMSCIKLLTPHWSPDHDLLGSSYVDSANRSFTARYWASKRFCADGEEEGTCSCHNGFQRRLFYSTPWFITKKISTVPLGLTLRFCCNSHMQINQLQLLLRQAHFMRNRLKWFIHSWGFSLRFK